MKLLTPVKRTVLSALFVALCVVLPIAVHSIPDAGAVILPMHIPVLICGMVCGWPHGFVCGLLGPLLSSLLTGMPAAAKLPAMMVECAVYGMVTNILLKYVHTKNTRLDLYIALLGAMLAGRLASGIAKALIFTPGLTMSAWIASSFITALPGITIQLILVPQLVCLLMKINQIPQRYPA